MRMFHLPSCHGTRLQTISLASVLLLLATLTISCTAVGDTAGEAVTPEVIARELNEVAVSKVYVTRMVGEGTGKPVMVQEEKQIQLFLKSVEKSSIVGLYRTVPEELGEPAAYLQLESAGGEIYVEYYAPKRLVAVPYFFFRKDRGPLELSSSISKADLEILRTRASVILLKPAAEFEEFLSTAGS